jgi:cold shock CspA family protein
MEIEFGQIKTYNIERGFGFLSRTFGKSNHSKSEIWFHISKVKTSHPELAKRIDSGSYSDIKFWYEFEEGNGKAKAVKIWLNSEEIPQRKKNLLVDHIEEVWSGLSRARSELSELLNQATVDLVGQSRRDELFENYSLTLARFTEELSEQIRRQIRQEVSPQLLEQIKGNIGKGVSSKRPASRNIRRETIGRSVLSRRHNSYASEEPANVYVGLPEHLADCVLWVAREYRSNPLSHIPGGSDVVVECHNNKAFGYDWIKRPSAYIKTFFAGIVEYESSVFEDLNEQQKINIAKQKISRIFARKYKNPDERSQARFFEVWNSDTSDEMPWKSLENFESHER